MDLGFLPPTLTPRDNPLDVILDFLLQRRATGDGGGGQALVVPVAHLLQECARHGFSLEESHGALVTEAVGLGHGRCGGNHLTARQSAAGLSPRRAGWLCSSRGPRGDRRAPNLSPLTS
eukprot:15477270-Alexandrium_andersonii.AAC.1